MKILFLDIDGVANCRKTTERFMIYIGIDKHLARRVRQIVKDTGCKVVLSSTWRLYKPHRDEVRDKVCDFISITKDLPSRFRGDEVNEWLERHPEVTKYAILDDNSDFHPDQKLFLTSFDEGLTPEIEKQVTEYLNENSVI